MNEQAVANTIAQWILEQEKHKGNHFETKFKVVFEGEIVVRNGIIMTDGKIDGHSTGIQYLQKESNIDTKLKIKIS